MVTRLISSRLTKNVVSKSHQPKDVLGIIGLVARLYQRLSPWVFESAHLKHVGNDILVTDHDSFLVLQSVCVVLTIAARKPTGSPEVPEE